MRKCHHHLEVGCVAVEGTAHLAPTRNASDILPAAGAAVRTAFIRWQGTAILVQEVDILHRPIPINIAGIVRLVIGAAFQQRNSVQRTRRNEVTG